MRPRWISNDAQVLASTFPGAGPLAFGAIDIMWPLFRTTLGSQHLAIVTDRCSKHTRATPIWKIKSTHIATRFIEIAIFLYGIPEHVRYHNISQLVSMFFTTLCHFLGAKKPTSTVYHLLANDEVRRYNPALDSKLRHYDSETQKNWDTYVLPLKFAYWMKANRTTGTSPCNVMFPLDLSSPATFDKMTSPANDMEKDVAWRHMPD